jgi:hypothetical protein
LEYSVIYWSVVYWIPYNVISWSEAIFKSPKMIRTLVFYLFWHHNGMYFFDILISKSGPTLIYFLHFDFEMCFAPQRRAIFRHLNFQKWREHMMFDIFWLGNIFHATTAYIFSTSQFPKVARWCGVWFILTWKYNFRATTACTYSTSPFPNVARTCGVW